MKNVVENVIRVDEKFVNTFIKNVMENVIIS